MTTVCPQDEFIVPDDPSPDFLTPLTRPQVLLLVGLTAVVLLIVARLWLMFDPQGFLPVDLTRSALLQGAVLGCCLTGASAVLYGVWPAYRQSADVYLALILKPLVWLDLVWIGMLPGLSEELLFRGVMLPSVGLNWVGVGVTSLFFGLLHLGGRQHWPYMIWATIVGALLGGSALLTGNLGVPITAHICTNVLAGISWKLREAPVGDRAQP